MEDDMPHAKEWQPISIKGHHQNPIDEDIMMDALQKTASMFNELGVEKDDILFIGEGRSSSGNSRILYFLVHTTPPVSK